MPKNLHVKGCLLFTWANRSVHGLGNQGTQIKFRTGKFQYAISEFQKNLTFKARLSAKPLMWKWSLIMMQIKLIFTTKVSHLASFYKAKFLGTRKWPIPFTGKRPRRPETGIKDDFEEIEHEVLFGISRPEKQDYLYRCSVAPANFPLERPKKSCSIYFANRFSRIFL